MATVLVVEDEFGIAELFAAVLGEVGHRVLIATNGRHGLDLLALESVDLIFLDYMMPVMNGPAMLAEMAGDANLRRIPVVLMSAMPEATVNERALGYAGFLRKPFRVAQVIALTTQFLGPPVPVQQQSKG